MHAGKSPRVVGIFRTVSVQRERRILLGQSKLVRRKWWRTSLPLLAIVSCYQARTLACQTSRSLMNKSQHSPSPCWIAIQPEIHMCLCDKSNIVLSSSRYLCRTASCAKSVVDIVSVTPSRLVVTIKPAIIFYILASF